MLSTKHSQSPIYANLVHKCFVKRLTSRVNAFGLHSSTQIILNHNVRNVWLRLGGGVTEMLYNYDKKHKFANDFQGHSYDPDSKVVFPLICTVSNPGQISELRLWKPLTLLPHTQKYRKINMFLCICAYKGQKHFTTSVLPTHRASREFWFLIGLFWNRENVSLYSVDLNLGMGW